jgi:hypothetical protein
MAPFITGPDMLRTARLDALDANPQAKPPDGQLAQVE